MLNGRRDIRPKGFKVQLSHLPSDIYGLFGLGMLCLTVLVAIYLIHRLTPPGGKTDLSAAGVNFSVSGGYNVVETQSELKLVQFWTPSVATGPNLCGAYSNGKCVQDCTQNPQVRAVNRWECTVTQAKVEAFEKVIESQFCAQEGANWFKPLIGRLWLKSGIKDKPADCDTGTIQGFHHYDEVGQAGDRPKKTGLWWEMTVTKNFDPRQFAKLYVDKWCDKNFGSTVKVKPDYDLDCREKEVYLEMINGSPRYSSNW